MTQTKFAARFETMFNKVKKNDDKAKLYTIVYLVRRLLYAVVVVTLNHSPSHQIVFLGVINCAYAYLCNWG